MENKVKKYSQFINEADDVSVDKNSSTFDVLKDEIKSMIENTIDKSGGEFKSFVDSFIKSPEDVKIEGLINDDQLYDFWLKYENEIDELLNNNKYFDKSPKDLNIIGVYKYVITSTQQAIELIVKMLK